MNTATRMNSCHRMVFHRVWVPQLFCTTVEVALANNNNNNKNENNYSNYGFKNQNGQRIDKYM